MSEVKTKATGNPRVVAAEANREGQAVATDQTTEPEFPRQYTVGAILFYHGQGDPAERLIAQAIAEIGRLSKAISVHQWNGLPTAGVLGIELQHAHGFLDGLAATGAAVELGKGRETDPGRLQALKAMVKVLSPSVVKMIADAVKESEGTEGAEA